MKNIHLLLVEDNEGDILLITEALIETGAVDKITVHKDGKSAMDFFQGIKGKSNVPDLIVLDINLPKKNGFEVLNFIKQRTETQQIPVIMLTTSSAERDIETAYRACANCYITKPIDAAAFKEAITKVQDFWLSTVSIPDR